MVQIQRRYALFLFSQGALLVYYLREDEHGVELSVKGNGGTECFTRPADGFIDYSGLPFRQQVGNVGVRQRLARFYACYAL